MALRAKNIVPLLDRVLVQRVKPQEVRLTAHRPTPPPSALRSRALPGPPRAHCRATDCFPFYAAKLEGENRFRGLHPGEVPGVSEPRCCGRGRQRRTEQGGRQGRYVWQARRAIVPPSPSLHFQALSWPSPLSCRLKLTSRSNGSIRHAPAEQDGVVTPVSVKEGDRVLLPPYGGSTVKLGDEVCTWPIEHVFYPVQIAGPLGSPLTTPNIVACVVSFSRN
ncbi:MAG: hypothetical protein BJ554DRAFT_99 [Olpidium bornovanus]|uniref:Uncharacterized protein n=1 Tax=Olpidium bornovanus TaxID=278681 RepID=A0A8H7ZTT5_9FUNG|nr:MAG: hypothetical protein BJ554DRAFT_99 [Olpidium bornovanus]